jgi:2-cysteine adaptor domain-containing protein
MNLPNAARMKSFLARTSLHATMVLAISLLLVVGFALNSRKPGGPQSVNPFTGQTIAPNNPLWHIPLTTP